jgi:adenylyl-sulfate kinase
MKWNRGKTIWFTGLSGSGKSTLSSMLKTILESRSIPVVLLDGDLLRSGLNRDLSFSAIDRAENIRRAGEVAKILSDAGHTVIAAFITPLEALRQALRNIFEPDRYIEIFLDCPLDVCESRDVKGLYCRARSGEIPEFTGISSPFETPEGADLVVSTAGRTVEESLGTVLSFLEARFTDLRTDSRAGTGGPTPRYSRKVAVIGLDGASPSLVFGEAGKSLRNLGTLMEYGRWGKLRSTDPPVTVPAWTTMTTGKDPGELGIYGFRNRLDHGYDPMITTNSSHVGAKRVWDYIEEKGRTSILIGIPQTYPPIPHKGITVAGFLTPGVESSLTYPEDLADEIHRVAGGEYLPDVKEFRTDEKDRLLSELHQMAAGRFSVASHLLLNRPWDFFMMVEMGTDRLNHAFWKHCMEDHPAHRADDPYRRVMRDFYQDLDARIGSLLAQLGDETTVLVVSDHGARSLLGGVRVNEWLIAEGYLVLREEPAEETRLVPDMIDWSRTTAWSEGGHYARLFLNVKGREPGGTVDRSRYDATRDEITQRLLSMRDEQGRVMATRTLKPERIYRSCSGVAPDLIVYFDGLGRRSIGTVGTGEVLCSSNDTGPDDANHDPEGILIAARMADLRSGKKNGREIEDASVLDITPTILHEFGFAVPGDLGGRIINIDGPDYDTIARAPSSRSDRSADEKSRPQSPRGYTGEEEEIIKKRLADLGYI